MDDSAIPIILAIAAGFVILGALYLVFTWVTNHFILLTLLTGIAVAVVYWLRQYAQRE